jgi:hypothetical protein
MQFFCDISTFTWATHSTIAGHQFDTTALNDKNCHSKSHETTQHYTKDDCKWTEANNLSSLLPTCSNITQV